MTVIFVIATILIFLGIDWFTQRSRATHAVAAALAHKPMPVRARTPEGIFFTPSHTWLNLFPSGKVRLGMDDFITRMLDNPEIVFLKQPGDTVHKGDPLLQCKEDGHTLTVRSPIDGDILDTNHELTAHPEYMKNMLFSQGWAYTLKPQRFTDLKQLLLGTETHVWMQREFGRLRDFFAAAAQGSGLAPAFLQDGGPPVANAMKSMTDEVWKQFESDFLTP
ncbi:MAG TPA: hypothetical protein VLY03_11800 [Bacteroidota bacterium]|nr:hypothetical protein [Bacteroidota bacterium]